jgi:hypothetical protein
MINAKELKEILKFEMTPEGKVLLLGMITDGGVGLNLSEVGCRYGLIPSEVHVGQCDLKSKQMVAVGETPSTFNVQREVVKYGSGTNISGNRAGHSKRSAANPKKNSKKNKE